MVLVGSKVLQEPDAFNFSVECFSPEYADSRFLQDIGTYVPRYTVSYPRIPEFYHNNIPIPHIYNLIYIADMFTSYVKFLNFEKPKDKFIYNGNVSVHNIKCQSFD